MRADSHQLRCFCSGKPWLATYGKDEQGRLFVHMKVYKQDRIYGEMICYGGEIKVHCRNCFRWHRIVLIATGAAKLQEDEPPAELK